MTDKDKTPVRVYAEQLDEKQTGYAEFFKGVQEHDKHFEEKAIVEILIDQSFLPNGNMQVEPCGPDTFPDIGLSAGDRNIGIEVTELVDGPTRSRFAAAKRAGKATPEPYNYDADILEKKIRELINRKSKKINFSKCFSKLYLAIFTDEPSIDLELVKRSAALLKNYESGFSGVFLVLSYQPQLGYHVTKIGPVRS